MERQTSGLGLPGEFVGLHIRRGDKVGEHRFRDCARYVELLRGKGLGKNIFIATDDSAVLREMESTASGSRVFSLAGNEDSGYYHNDFVRLDWPSRRRRIVRLLAEIEILSKASWFIGAYDSNIGMFLGMRRACERCLDVDGRAWMIW